MGEGEAGRWVEIDEWGKALAGRQGAIDVEIGEWLIAARGEEVHKRLGLGSFFDYAEARLGLDGHAVLERVRVAGALERLEDTREALRSGALCWSSVRELTRVVVPETEKEWLEATRGMNKRQVEKAVSGRSPGQRPGDPADPRVARHVIRIEVSGETHALWREAMRVMRKGVDASLEEEQVLAEAARQILGGPGDEGRAPYQVALNQCEDCGRTFQQARGEDVPVAPEVLERAQCDGQHLGSVRHAASPGGLAELHRSSPGGLPELHGSSPGGLPAPQASSPGGRPAQRATQTIPPAVRRLVMRRDRGRCRVPGCRSSIWLEVHHLLMREEGGGMIRPGWPCSAGCTTTWFIRGCS